MFRLTTLDPLTSEVLTTETIEGIGAIRDISEHEGSLIVLGSRPR